MFQGEGRQVGFGQKYWMSRTKWRFVFLSEPTDGINSRNVHWESERGQIWFHIDVVHVRRKHLQTRVSKREDLCWGSLSLNTHPSANPSSLTAACPKHGSKPNNDKDKKTLNPADWMRGWLHLQRTVKPVERSEESRREFWDIARVTVGCGKTGWDRGGVWAGVK